MLISQAWITAMGNETLPYGVSPPFCKPRKFVIVIGSFAKATRTHVRGTFDLRQPGGDLLRPIATIRAQPP
jgi:hypothetical protein